MYGCRYIHYPVFHHSVQKGSTFSWGYLESNGPLIWPKFFPQCGGSKQSPVALDSASSLAPYRWPPLGFKNYDKVPSSMTLINNGHVAQVEAELSERATVQGGELGGHFAFLQFHFHWGATNRRGSEHTIDGKRFPAELHLVHYNTEYGSVEEAVKYEDGLAVLGIMLVISPTDNPKLDNIIKGLSRVITDGKYSALTAALTRCIPCSVHHLQLSLDASPSSSSSLQHDGMPSYPRGCTVVLEDRTIVDEPPKSLLHYMYEALMLYFGRRRGMGKWRFLLQLAEFRKLQEENGLPLVDNFRPVQPLNGRTVFMGGKKPYWGYKGEFAPSQWVIDFPLCGGSRQSPINLDPFDAKPMISSPFVFTNYDTFPTSATIMNNGHTAQVMLDTAKVPTISGGGLTGNYAFLQFHFHWGANDSVGSEHTIRDKRFPAELHLVHYKTEYGSVEEAVKYEDGLAVLGINLIISPLRNSDLEGIIAGLSNIQKAGTDTIISILPLENLLPATTNVFFRYQGSLTTPTCAEIVQWTVFPVPIPISSEQIKEFRKLEDTAGKLLLNTYRPIQPKNDRTVYISGSLPN
ncbi:uncharacterized protein [Panulirus ornatus]|uniref:uncharacterized protein n=1 Tax=Panulirus ornatus TaxID=150431 RepID=UPI003A8633BD